PSPAPQGFPSAGEIASHSGPPQPERVNSGRAHSVDPGADGRSDCLAESVIVSPRSGLRRDGEYAGSRGLPCSATAWLVDRCQQSAIFLLHASAGIADPVTLPQIRTRWRAHMFPFDLGDAALHIR